MNNKPLFAMLFLIIGLALFNFSCNDDCPSCPEPPVDPDGNYNFYISQNSRPQIYVYNIGSRGIIDSLDFGLAQYFLVSADGSKFYKTLYWMDQASDTIFVLSNPDLDTLDKINYRGGIESSNTGAYLALLSDSLMILSENSFTVLLLDTIQVRNGMFSISDNRFYCLSGLNQIRIYDLINMKLDTVINISIDTLGTPAIHAIQTVTDPGVIYLTLNFNDYVNYLVSYHIDSDSCGLWYRLTGRASGALAYSDFRNILIVTDPDNDIENYGSKDISLINVEKNNIVSILHPDLELYQNMYPAFNPRHLSVTPDGRYLFALDAWGRGFAIIDLITLSIYDTYRSYTVPLYNVSCQKLK